MARVGRSSAENRDFNFVVGTEFMVSGVGFIDPYLQSWIAYCSPIVVAVGIRVFPQSFFPPASGII